MFLTSLRCLIFCLCFCLLIACQTKRTENAEAVTVEDLTVKTSAELDRQINRAISHLEQGNNSHAILLIDEVLTSDPDHKAALFLRQQLTQTASQLFNTRRFIDYKIKRGDTLGAIASEWLGDPLYFVSLAKLNQIESPDLLESGLTIKIPVIAEGKTITQETNQSLSNIKQLEKYLDQEEYLEGLKKINSLFIIKKHQHQLNEIQNKLLIAYADSAFTLTDLEKIIEEALLLVSSSKKTQHIIILQNFIDQQKHRKQQILAEQAEVLFKEQNYLASADKLIQTKEVDKNLAFLPPLLEQTNKLENKVIDKLHEQAIIHYRNQVLDEALKLWKLISQLQPDNELALKYIQRTNNLINKLNKY